MGSQIATPSFILASRSPRRQELLARAGFKFKTISVDVDESFKAGNNPVVIAAELALRKLKACDQWLEEHLVLTADTLVFIDKMILGKPHDREDARAMLKSLSGRKHQVVTAVCLGYHNHIHKLNVVTDVYFGELTEDEIAYYIENYQPFDKAGSYGIQDWIGDIGIHHIEGSYTNVVGLPMHETYVAIIEKSKEWFTE